MADLITATEWLEIATVPLATPAWRILDLTPLFSSADIRGSDQVLPGAPGVRANRRRVTATKIALDMVIWGDRNRENTPYANVRVGLLSNVNALHTAVVTPPAGDGTRAAIWHQAGATTAAADVHVLGLAVRSLSPRSIRATLQLSIPQGRFT